ncbi:hypothetical protein ACLB2K_075047 [Fragaria x ananassa]
MGPITWPGDSASIPKGREVPTNGKKLRVGVSVKIVSPEFVKVVHNPVTNATEVTGFCIYIFKANFDALAAATTIRGNRSLYVDFTLPYTESGVNTVRKTILMNLHNVKSAQACGFSFTVMVSHQNEASNLSKFVVILWLFVAPVLTQSYAASLSTILTVQQLATPTYTDIDELVQNKDYTGYPKGSFVHDLLIQRGFDDSKIKVYTSPDECDQLLTRGSANGGPVLLLLLMKHPT